MATKQQLIDEAYWKIKDARDGNAVHRDLVTRYMGSGWNQILHDAFSKRTTFMDFYAKEYTALTPALSTENQYSLALPVAIAQLPLKGEGVRRVQGAGTDFATGAVTGVKFVPLSEFAMRYKDNIDAGLADATIIGYTVRYDSIWFDKNMTAALAAAKVNLLLVVPFDVYTSTELLPVPSGKEVDLINVTIQLALAGQQQQQ